MEFRENGCLICGRELTYLNEQQVLECSVCHMMTPTNTVCSGGHFVCDSCHEKGALDMVTPVCLESGEKDPVRLFLRLVSLPGVHMHGPEHHVIVGSALLTAYRNCGGDLDLESSLAELRKRAGQVPGGVCGLWGACGAGISCGMAFSIISGSTPLSGESWGLSNLMTSECLAAISRTGGPRCCKRDGITALVTAARFVTEHTDVSMDVSGDIHCGFHPQNRQCLGGRCPYHPE